MPEEKRLDGFAIVPLDLLARKDLKPASKLVWINIEARRGIPGWVFYVSRIAKETGLHRETAGLALVELEKLGLLQCRKIRHNSVGKSDIEPSENPTLQVREKEEEKEEIKNKEDKEEGDVGKSDTSEKVAPENIISLSLQGSSLPTNTETTASGAILGQLETREPAKGVNVDHAVGGSLLSGEAELRKAIALAQADKRVQEAIAWRKQPNLDDFDAIFGTS